MAMSSDELKEKLERLHRMSAQDLAQLEKVIAKDFRDLASRYVRARLVRGKAIHSQLASQLECTTTKEASWNRIVGFELETIASLASTSEDLVTRRPGALSSLREYDDELSAVCRSLEGPLSFDPSIIDPTGNNVPYSKNFSEVFASHVKRLRLIASEQKYLERLANNLARANAEIAWSQYFIDVVERKNLLIEETERQLIDLDKEYARPRRQHRRHWYKPLARARRAIASRQFKRETTDHVILKQSFCLSQSEMEDDLIKIKSQTGNARESVTAGNKMDGNDKQESADVKDDLSVGLLPALLENSTSLHDEVSSVETSALDIDVLDIHTLDTNHDDSLGDDSEPGEVSNVQASPRTRYRQLLYSQGNIWGLQSGFRLPLFPPLPQ